MSQIKTFDDMLDCEPKLKLGEFINLLLAGNDDKIYIDIHQYTKDGYRSKVKVALHNVRIISPELLPYYDCYIEYVTDPCDKDVLLDIMLVEEVINEENAT